MEKGTASYMLEISGKNLKILKVCINSSLGHLIGRTNSLEKPLMLGKIEGRRRRG